MLLHRICCWSGNQCYILLVASLSFYWFYFFPPNFYFLSFYVGFPVTLTCTLFNTSFVPITFALRVLGDGLGSPSVSFDKQVSNLSRKNWQGYAVRDFYSRPLEFTVSPAAGSVRAMSDVSIKVKSPCKLITNSKCKCIFMSCCINFKIRSKFKIAIT